MQIGIRSTAAGLALALAGYCTVAAAQLTPGQVGDTLKRPEPLRAPAATPQLETRKPAPPAVAPGGKQVTVSRFDFAGNTLFSNTELAALISEYTRRPVTLLEIYEAADRIADFYVGRGYTLASVTIPPQRLSDGAVLLQISEGRIADIGLQNNDLYRAEQIRRYFPDVTPGSVYRGAAVEDDLRTLNGLPGLKARAVLRPGEQYGTTDMIVRVEEKPLEGWIAADNYGRDDIGQFRISALGQFNNPLKVEDRLTLMAMRSQDSLLTYGYVEYSVPLNFSGTRLKASYGQADFDVPDSLIDGRNRAGRLLIEQPLLRRGATQLSLSGGVSRTLANADFTGQTFNGTGITLFELGAVLTHSYESLAVTQFSTLLRTNFESQDREDLNPASGVVSHGRELLRWEVDVQHLQPLFWHTQLLAHLNGVYSPDPLVDTEQYSLGGPDSIRGYPTGEIRGDRGYFGSLTWSRPFGWAGLLWSPRVFVEAGSAYLVDAPTGIDRKASLTSTGVGLDVGWDRVSVRADWAFPLDNRVVSDEREHSRAFASMNVAF
ncbi:ShlB/FhaC/HecB family hemolysin secretion/activation protein [Solimonas soli]|uniref:ShlB/FhaC/HecB family hemolysin secretion/activation protein n=1 Tax=Solimonas soli TaxID=413479 RepID=UPI00048A2FCD|nr:ShlB/FhaC/HecB family hemolysin secretion/activation protein [Solimonas soli]